jgi:uncharacterized protein (DUF3084 family)
LPCARAVDEIREESIARSERADYPLIKLSPDDVREAFSKIPSGTAMNGQWASAGDNMLQERAASLWFRALALCIHRKQAKSLSDHACGIPRGSEDTRAAA